MRDAKRWPGDVFRRYLPDGEVREKWVCSVNGLGLTYWPTHSVLWAEVSLPKALNGRNDLLLDEDDEDRALALVDERLADLLPLRVPAFASWSPRRLDAVRQVNVGSRFRLSRVLRTLRDADVPRWGSPVVGQAGSCTWGGRGSQRARAYDKYREVVETGGSHLPDEDLLRVESVLRRVRETMKAKSVTLVAAMRSGVAERPLERIWPRVEAAIEGADGEVKETTALLKLVKAHGVSSGVRLLGFALLASKVDRAELEDIIGNPATYYRWAKELRDAGVDPAAVEWSDDSAPGLGSMRRLTELRHAAERYRREHERGARETA